MSAPTEPDAILVLSVAKLLSVELDPWQERMLLAMFSAHREPAAERGPYGQCDSRFSPSPDRPTLLCARTRGHTGPHGALESDRGIQWPNLG